MANAKALLDMLNSMDFQAWRQKDNPKRVTLHFRDEDSKRYFITRVATNELGPDGKAIWKYAKGAQLKDRDA
jgi:hypothetical protein